MKRVSVLANDDRREELKACGLNFAELGLKEMSFDQHIQSGNLNSETDLVIVAGGDEKKERKKEIRNVKKKEK